MNSLKTDMIKDNQDFNERFEALYEKIGTKSRLSSRASSRATSPKQLMKQLHEKLPEFELPLMRPRGQDIFWDAKAADDFAEENKGQEKRERKPAVYQRDNTISRRETFAAINRPGNPVMKETFTSPLTLEKCLTFERDMLDFQQKYNVEVRNTNYVDTDLKYEIRARFGLTNSDFYEVCSMLSNSLISTSSSFSLSLQCACNVNIFFGHEMSSIFLPGCIENFLSLDSISQ